MDLENYFDIKDLLRSIATDEGKITAAIAAEAIERQVFADARLFFEEESESANYLSDLRFTDHATLSAFLADLGHRLFCYGNVGLRLDRSAPGEARLTFIAPDFSDTAPLPDHIAQVRACTESRLADGFGRSFLHEALAACMEMNRAYHSVIMETNEQLKRHGMRRTLMLRAQVVQTLGLVYSRDGKHTFSTDLAQRLFDESERVFVDDVVSQLGGFEDNPPALFGRPR